MSHTITIEVEDDDGNFSELELPTCWEICTNCKGEGHHVHDALRVMTSSEWHEACYDDDEFAEGYMRGNYDVPCEDCNGSGKVREVDEARLTPEQRKHWEFHVHCESTYQQERESELRYGY